MEKKSLDEICEMWASQQETDVRHICDAIALNVHDAVCEGYKIELTVKHEVTLYGHLGNLLKDYGLPRYSYGILLTANWLHGIVLLDIKIAEIKYKDYRKRLGN